MSILPPILNFVGFVVFLFVFWKRLREDYSSLAIFSGAFYMAMMSTVLALVAGYLGRLIPSTTVFTPSGLWFWAGVVGAVVGLIIANLKFKLKFFETLEAAALGFLYWLAFVFGGDAMLNSSVVSLIAVGVVLVHLALFYFIATSYRRLTWYKSGRLGIAALLTLSLFFGVRVAVALIFPYVLSFVGKFDALLSGTVVVLLIYGVNLLSGDY